MLELPQVLQNAVDEFSKLPGIGQKSALRHVIHLANMHKHDIVNFGVQLGKLAEINSCEQCGFYTETTLCEICKDEFREQTAELCVVETISDCMAIENSGSFKGVYQILGGVLNPLIGVGPEELGISGLINRIKTKKVKNVLLAINPSVEGDATCSYISELLADEDVEIDRIGFGIPMGGSLEYLDTMTISKAMENKRRYI